MADYPAMPLWTDSYLADTRHLSTLEHGAYFLLLIEAWRRPTCSLPDDDAMLARLAGLSSAEWKKVKPTIMAFWKRDGRTKTWSQKRQSLERDYVSNKSASQRDKAAKRWNKTKKDDAAALPKPCRSDAPIPIPIPIEEEDKSSPSSAGEVDRPLANRKGEKYAFAGTTIRLLAADMDGWRKTFHAIPDLAAELTGIDAWMTGQPADYRKGWFQKVPGMLAKKHGEYLERRPAKQGDLSLIAKPYRPRFSEHGA